MKSGVYKITINNRIYIGSAVNLERRKNAHLYSLRRQDHCNIKMQRSYNKHKSFIFEVLEYCSCHDLINREQWYIDTLRPFFNVCQIAGSTLGIKHTEETRAYLSEIRKGKKTSLGRVLSDITRAKISEKCKARGLHPNFIKASVEANTGRKHSKELRDKIAAAQSKVSPENVIKIRQMRASGVFQKDIARMFNISQRLVARVEHGVGLYKEFI